MSSAVESMIGAVLPLLKSDAGVKALLGGPSNVFDVVPANNLKKPWVYLGPVGTKRVENDCHRLWEIRLRIFCAVDDFGRSQAWAIADAVDLALDTKRPTLDPSSGFGLVSELRMAESGDIIDPTKPQSVFTDVVGIIGRLTPLFPGADA